MGMVLAGLLLSAAAVAPPPVRIRVCTYGGEGACSGGLGRQTLAALRFLAPAADGWCAPPLAQRFEFTGCGCLARCDRGVVLQRQDTGEYVEHVNDVRAAASLLRSMNVQVDARLIDAYAAKQKGDEVFADGKPTQALNAYNRAFGLAAAAGLGVRWRSRPSSVLRARARAGSGGGGAAAAGAAAGATG